MLARGAIRLHGHFRKNNGPAVPAKSHQHQACCRSRRQGLSPFDQRPLYPLALGFRLADPDRFLRPVLAALAWSAGRVVRYRYAQVLFLRPRSLAAGHDLPRAAHDPRRLHALPVYRRGRAIVVRLHLPADGLYRDFSVVRENDRGRAAATHQARCRTVVCTQNCAQERQARDMAALFAVDRDHLCRLFHADPRSDERYRHPVARRLVFLLGCLLRTRDLWQRRLPARPDVPPDLPLRPLPVRDVRP